MTTPFACSRSLAFLTALILSLSGTAALAQQTQGELGNSSNGTIGMAFEKRDSNVEGVTVLSATQDVVTLQLPDAAVSALRNSGTAKFELCIVGASRNGISLTRLPRNQRLRAVVNDLPFEYDVSLVTDSPVAQSAEGDSGCAGGSLIQVQVSTSRDQMSSQAALLGTIPILVITE